MLKIALSTCEKVDALGVVSQTSSTPTVEVRNGSTTEPGSLLFHGRHLLYFSQDVGEGSRIQHDWGFSFILSDEVCPKNHIWKKLTSTTVDLQRLARSLRFPGCFLLFLSYVLSTTHGLRTSRNGLRTVASLRDRLRFRFDFVNSVRATQ